VGRWLVVGLAGHLDAVDSPLVEQRVDQRRERIPAVPVSLRLSLDSDRDGRHALVDPI
jgi:hypothetical protein